MVGPNSFRFLNVEHTLEQRSDWNRADWTRLWLYNLHYFDDLAARDGEARATWHRALIARWIAENPPPHGAGWEPYPTSLRIVNWVKWALGGNELDTAALHSLAVQARWLSKRLEFHLLGNHLWANAKALTFAGAFFAGKEGARWFRRGIDLVNRELGEQILPDGGHFERSPMYHAIVLEDLLDLIQLAARHPTPFDAGAVAGWSNMATRMLHWLRVMTHPDGGIAFFNDAALGIAQIYAELADYAVQLGVAVPSAPLRPLEALAASGYIRMQAGDSVLIADVGEIGPTYLPGHAHADTLSFEWSLAGRRVLVNGGTSTYETGDERLRQRGTAAHNAVVVNGKDSSEVWSAFRVGRRAHPHLVAWGENGDELWLHAAHDGYAHLRGRPIHAREWRLAPGRLTITDRVDGHYAHAAARFRLAPAWHVDGPSVTSPPAGASAAAVVADSAAAKPDRSFRIAFNVPDEAPAVDVHVRPDLRIGNASYHPAFGVDQPCQVVVVPLDPDGAAVNFAWRP